MGCTSCGGGGKKPSGSKPKGAMPVNRPLSYNKNLSFGTPKVKSSGIKFGSRS